MMMMRRRMTTTSFWISVDARSQNYNPNGLFVSAYHLINYPIDHTYYPSVGNLLNKIKVEQRHSFISNLRSFSCQKKINDEIMMMKKIMGIMRRTKAEMMMSTKRGMSSKRKRGLKEEKEGCTARPVCTSSLLLYQSNDDGNDDDGGGMFFYLACKFVNKYPLKQQFEPNLELKAHVKSTNR